MASYSLSETTGMTKKVSEMCSSSSYEDLNSYEVICVGHMIFFGCESQNAVYRLNAETMLGPPDRFLHSYLCNGWLFKVCVWLGVYEPQIPWNLLWDILACPPSAWQLIHSVHIMQILYTLEWFLSFYGPTSLFMHVFIRHWTSNFECPLC